MVDRIPSWVMKLIIAVVQRWPRLNNKVNAWFVNGLVNVCPHRPHPWSTVHDYVSWTSLTDHSWSGRHLPAVAPTPNLPSSEKVVGLFQRRNNEQRYCNKSTCLFPAFAQYLTDGILRTRTPRKSASDIEKVLARKQNTSNHQLDLCMLYGLKPEQTDALRLKSSKVGEKGKLKSQQINGEEYAHFLLEDGHVKREFQSLDEPLGLEDFVDQDLRAHIFAFGGDRTNSTPQVAMMNTLFLREHNRLALKLEESNPSWDDERVFQTTRNTLIVLFIKIVVEEYINHISASLFRLRVDPSMAWDAGWNKPNWITTEFSLLYRWHSLIPDQIRWNSHTYSSGKTFMDNRLLLMAGLTKSFVELSSQRAGRLGAFNTPSALHMVEMLAIEQGRICQLAGYADYRELVSLPRPQHFDDISADSDVVEFLRATYKSPADIDFYVGLFAEDPVKNSPLPPLILRMVAVDAFSQALTNPLLSRRVFCEETFAKVGWEAIHNTNTLRDVLGRNSRDLNDDSYVGMTRQDWAY